MFTLNLFTNNVSSVSKILVLYSAKCLFYKKNVLYCETGIGTALSWTLVLRVRKGTLQRRCFVQQS